MAEEQTLSFPGFQHINDCFAGPPSGRAIQSPIPSICATLINLSNNMFVDWTANEKAFGFRIATPIPAFPLSNQTRTNYAPIGPAAAQVRPVVYPNGYFNRPFLPTNPWPGDVKADSDGIVIRGAGAIPKAQAVPPEMDPEARPVDSYPSHPLTLPTQLLWARRAYDASQPAGQRSESGPPPASRAKDFDWSKTPAWEGYAPSVPVPERAVEIGDDGKAIEIPHVRPLLRAGAGTHERKVKAPMAGGWKGGAVSILKKGFGEFTEASDMIDAVYWALPEELRKKLWLENGRHELGTKKQMEALYKHYREIDPVQAAYNLAFQQMQDDVIGMASGGIVEATNGSPLAMTISRYTKALKASESGYQ